MTPFRPSDHLFGREHDLDSVSAMFQAPECRLVTLSGPGGVGKTRMAQRIAELMSIDFADGVYFIPLHALTSAQHLVSAILEHLGTGIHGTDDPSVQLLHVLQDRCLLLVLDNFEHLLEARRIVTSIVEKTRHVKVLVTSREVLNLHQEWVWQMRGIEYPQADDTVDAMNYAAVRMFDARARRVFPEFSLQRELPAIIQICALVEGNPLAIELAAAWLKSFTCRDILDELCQDIDLLSTGMDDIPEQHRSIRAVFDHSWRLLTDDEQYKLMCLSLFHGSFTHAAAKGVAGTSRLMLNTLINKSLLYHNHHSGRYQFHQLFRQYVYRHLLNNADTFTAADAAFIVYFRDFLAVRAANLWTSRQHEVVTEVTSELDNIRSIAVRLAFTEEVSISRKAMHMLTETYHLRGYFQDVAVFMSQIVAQLDSQCEDELDIEHLHLLAETLNGLGWSYIRLGEFDAAEAMLLRARHVYDTHQIQPAIGLGTDPRGGLAELKLILGNSAAALTLGEAVNAAALSRNDPLNRSTALYLLSSIAFAAGDYTQANVHIHQAITLTRQAGNEWFLACCFYQMGHICCEQQNYVGASGWYEDSFRIRETFGDLEGQAQSLNHLGSLTLLQDQYTRAVELFQKSHSLYQRIGNRGGSLATDQGLAIAHTALGHYDQAHEHLMNAVKVASETQLPSWWLSVCEAVGEFFAATGAYERGLMLVRLAFHRQETSSMTRARAARWLQLARHNLTQIIETDLNIIVQQLEYDLSTYVWRSTPSSNSHNNHPHLIEPLSERELEILYLIAQGMTNQEIADHLILMVSTVKTYNYNIFGKLHVKNRGQAVRRAQQLKLL